MHVLLRTHARLAIKPCFYFCSSCSKVLNCVHRPLLLAAGCWLLALVLVLVLLLLLLLQLVLVLLLLLLLLVVVVVLLVVLLILLVLLLLLLKYVNERRVLDSSRKLR